MKQDNYQYNYTDNVIAQHNMYDEKGRRIKSKKITQVLLDNLGSFEEKSTLEISCSAGYMSKIFAEHFPSLDAIDIDEKAINFANKNNSAFNINYHTMDALNMSFEKNSFDIVICNQMYEHVPDAHKLMSEIFRVLKPSGTCYFGATNRLKVIETHYGRIPFLSWLPKPLAHLYLKILGKGDHYYETLFSYWGLKKLIKKFELTDYTIQIIRSPQKFYATDVITPNSLGQRLILIFLKYFYFLSPGYVWLLKKPTK
ncbi:MAG: class I SAM-dependent methyltransferase [Kangiellaceae bacterium]|nr:class I SAM-dependent methyltransferase [Kangiellaceae bacterium]MCW8997648.1 class I SAM-dependent methyltransferase [Kangiellaceae bacterium]